MLSLFYLWFYERSYNNNLSTSLLHIDNSLGFSGSTFSCGAYGDALIIEAQAERKNFAKAINFLSDAINYPHLTTVKVNTTTANILNNIPSLRLSATDVLRSLHNGLYFSNKSNIHHTSFLRQKTFLSGLLEEIKTDSQSIIDELYGLIRTLARPESAFVYLATNADELVRYFGSGLPMLSSLFNVSAKLDQTGLSERFVLKSEYEYRKVEEDSVPRHVAFGVGGTESCYLKQSMLYNNTDWTHKEVRPSS